MATGKIIQFTRGDTRKSPERSILAIDVIEDVQCIHGGHFEKIEFRHEDDGEHPSGRAMGEGVYFFLPIKIGSPAHEAIRDFLDTRPDLDG